MQIKNQSLPAQRIISILLLLGILSSVFGTGSVSAIPAEEATNLLTNLDLDNDASKWAVFKEGSPTWRKDNVAAPSLDGRSLRCGITGGAPYSNVHCYRNLSADPDSRLFTLSMSFYYRPASTFNNVGGPSVVQALEFTMNKWDQGVRYEWAVQWNNVGPGAPKWRYWDPHQPSGKEWVDLGIAGSVAGEQWHTLKLEGEIHLGKVHYLRLIIDGQVHSLAHLSVSPALAPGEEDRLAVAVQLDGNATETPYDLLLDRVTLTSPMNTFVYIPPYGTPLNGADTLTGRVQNVTPSEYYLVCYIMVINGGWWIKPRSNGWETPISDSIDSTGRNWGCDIGTGGIDDTAQRIEAYLVPKTRKSSTVPPRSWLDLHSVAKFVTSRTKVEAHIGPSASPVGSYVLKSWDSLRQSFSTLNNGPVKLRSITSMPILAAERVIYKVNGVDTSFSEMMALPNSQLDKVYWLPWYNNANLDTQLRIANVSNSPATVHILIGGTEMTTGCTHPNSPYIIPVGGSVRVSCPGVNDGPVQLVSDQNIVAAERVIHKVNGVNTSFSEMMALPESQLDNIYWLPWYNNLGLDTQLRIANVSSSPATVRVLIGGREMSAGCTPPGSPYTVPLGSSIRVSCPGVNDGPVQLVSDQNIVAAERVIYKVNGVDTSFSEMMALPNSQLDKVYWLPWYNNLGLDTQLRIANVSSSPAHLHIYIANRECAPPSIAYPFAIAPGGSVRVSCPGVNNGLVKIVSDQNIVAAERVILNVNGVNTSFSEMMALPESQLDVIQWVPWYNNLGLDTQLRFGLP